MLILVRWPCHAGSLVCAVAVAFTAFCRADPVPFSAPRSIWHSSSGSGFCAGAQSLSIMAGASYGFEGFGNNEEHHLALGSIAYGRMISRVMGEGRWWQGNWELRLELFGGPQVSPDVDWLIGLTPHLRYNFATGSRWIPFIDGGLGVTATDIGKPDLGGVFQFNEHAGIGVHWLLRDRLTLTFEARYFHVSNAGLEEPNRGLDGIIGMIGVTRFF